MPSTSVFTIFSAVVVLLYAVGVHYLMYAPKDRSCAMTYMFEYPQFVRIAMSDEVTHAHKRYSLWAYSEGHHIEAMRKMKFSGIPVLFLPGSAGSHKQARSLASVSMRKALNSRSPFHLDFFTTDLNEEHSAVYGGALEPQTEFVRQSIYRILELYRGSKDKRPTSVVIVAHSMSGVIAKGIFNDISFDPSLVKVILTFATPHSRPVVLFDEYSYHYYRATSKTWRLGRENRLGHISLTSVGGSYMDFLVQTDSIASWDIDVHTVTTTVPTVWRSVDHLAILWCKELVLVTARALFDMVDLETKQITNDRDLRNSILSYHFLHRNSGKQYRKAIHQPFVTFMDGSDWVEPLYRQFTVSANIDPTGNDRLKRPKHIMIRLIDHILHSALAVEAINHQEGDWVFACQANFISNDKRVCKNGENLSNSTMFLPTKNHKRKQLVLDLHRLQQEKKFSHIVLRIPHTNDPVQIHVDVHNPRILKPPAVGLWMLFDTRPVVLVQETAQKALFYTVDFSEIESLWHVLNLVVKPVSCSKEEHHAVAMLSIPWSNEKLFSFINEAVQNPLPVRLLHVKPRMRKDIPKTIEQNVRAEISLDPNCRYQISVTAAPGLLLSQFARSLTPCVFAYVVAILLLTLREQLLSYRRSGKCSLFHIAMSRGAKPFYILPLCKMLTRLLSQGDDLNSDHFLTAWGIPEQGMNLMARTPMENLLFPFFLYVCAFGIVYCAGFIFMFCLIFNAKVFNVICLSFVGQFFKRSFLTCIGPFNLTEFLGEFMIKAPPVVVITLLMVGSCSCGALSLILGGIFFYYVLCNMYNDYLEALFLYSMRVVTGRERVSLEGIANPGANKSNSSGSKEDETLKYTEKKAKASSSREQLKGTKRADHSSKNTDLCLKNADAKHRDHSSSDDLDEKEDERNSLSDINMYMTIFLIYVTAIVPSIPSLLTWAHNYNFDHSLNPDPVFIPLVLIVSSIGSTFWTNTYPHPKLPYLRIIADSLFVLATVTLLYAPTRISFINYIISAAMVILAAHQWLTNVYLFFFPTIYTEHVDSENESDADSINDNRLDSSHSGSDDEVADGDDEGGDSASNSDYNEDVNDTEARKAFPICKVAHDQETEDESSDAECEHSHNGKESYDQDGH
ncbi:GPI inositol-deacylase [Thrips palmi]|uniref:GPI inositol-deacylase n=1 Tax=Thrips palmi TaxID=161013 RepID=A0A6P8ZNK9_THRPL|nr:GPI inositol-deacylase [Thrips palmi]